MAFSFSFGTLSGTSFVLVIDLQLWSLRAKLPSPTVLRGQRWNGLEKSGWIHNLCLKPARLILIPTVTWSGHGLGGTPLTG